MDRSIFFKAILEALRDNLLEKTETGFTEYQAFNRIAAEWLGFEELDEENFVDAGGDRGVDFWFASDSGFEIFQVKSHRLGASGEIQTELFDNEGVKDLPRIKALLMDETASKSDNTKVRRFKQEWDSAIARRRIGEQKDPFQVLVGLVLFGDGLTDPAQIEYDSVNKLLRQTQEYKGIPVEFRPKLFTIDDVVNARWRQDNREWRDRSLRRRDSVDLHPESVGKWISGTQSTIFYCKAIDLIRAFDDFGYQIFEPNVRAHVGKTKVNMAIKESLMHSSSRREFKFLNNGLTITCSSYSNPTENRPSFRVKEPGVINGLQTVVSVHEAYSELPSEEQDDLERNCYVLVRLLTDKAVKDIISVVLASNTQNPMQARNLKSNTTEQVHFEKLLAEMGWFYERKQGSWEAFSKEPRRWRTLSSYRKANFQFTTGGRARARKIDNQLLAQTWFSFTGFSDEAVHNKRDLFDRDDWYQLLFLRRTNAHGADLNYDPLAAREECVPEAPSPALMLVSYLAREFAKAASLSAKESREKASQRLRIDPSLISKEELESKLAGDKEYLLDQVLNGMSFVFTEFLGYILFKAFGAKVHNIAARLLQNRSLKQLKETNDFDIVAGYVRDENIQKDDLLAIAWFAFRHTIQQMMATPWKENYLRARSRTRFNHDKETRTSIYKELDEVNKFMEEEQLTRFWAAGIPANTGLYNFFQKTLYPEPRESA